MSSMYRFVGAAKVNEATEIGRVDGAGPVVLTVNNKGPSDIVVSVSKLSDESIVMTDKDTAVSAEDTGYNGDTVTLDFTGQSLNNVPIIPGTILVIPPAGGDTVNATDRDGDGKLYTDDGDEDECGFVNYHTGAIDLSYPAGKAPNTGDIDCDYKYSVKVVPGGIQVMKLANVPPTETYVVKVAAKMASNGASSVRIDALSTF